MALPARYDARIVAGEVWAETFFVEDEATPPNPVDLTGRDVALVLSGGTTETELTDGAGLTVTAAAGRVDARLDADVTKTLAATALALWLDRETPNADVLVTGNVYVMKGATP